MSQTREDQSMKPETDCISLQVAWKPARFRNQNKVLSILLTHKFGHVFFEGVTIDKATTLAHKTAL